MTVILALTSLSGRSLISTPSISIWPPAISTILLIDKQIVLLPAPVLPTTPIFSPAFTSKDKFLRTISVFGRYFKVTSSKTTFPFSGHYGLEGRNLPLEGAASVFSYGISRTFRHLSTFTILASMLLISLRVQIRKSCKVKI